MAEIKVKGLVLKANGKEYRIVGSRLEDICNQLGVTENRFIELLSRDAYCPTLSAAPTTSTLTYTDTDGSSNHFQVGQLCRWAEGSDYRFAICKNVTLTAASWQNIPVKMSELTNDKGYLTSHQDISHLATKSELSAKQDVISDLATIRSGASKGATALQTETDPVFSASAAAGIKSSDITNWNSKTSNTGTVTGVKINGTTKSPSSGVVDLGTVITSHQDISGKLDATTAASTYLTKTDASSTYLGKSAKAASATKADSATKATQDGSGNVITSTYATQTALAALQTQLNTLVNADADAAINTFNEIIAFLAGVENTDTLDGIIAGINTEIAKKADKGDSIKNITRSGNTFTATRADGTTFTFTQTDNNTTYTFAGGTNKFTVTPSGGTAQEVTITPSIAEATTSKAGLMSSSDKTKLNGIASGAEVNVQSDWNVTDTTSDAYIKNKPTIPSAVTESTVSGWGFTKNTGTYSKPSSGIPSTDLSSDVQSALTKANSALQSETYKGTVTGVKINGTTKSPISGVVDLGTVITSHQDISGKLDATTAASTYLTKTDASNTYLGKTAKAASATNADSATKATQDASGNVITSTYATKTELSAKGTYSKPSTGIPSTDLASSVQTSLGKADTALQSYTEKYTGTITGVSANGTSVATSGVANIPAASTSIYGVTKLTSATNSTSTTLAATASAVKAAYDLAASKTSNAGTITGITMNGTSKGTSGVVDLGTVITSHQDISGKADKSSLATVATSGSYNDLTNKPTIPSAVSESTVSGWGFTKNTGTVTKVTAGTGLSGGNITGSGTINLASHSADYLVGGYLNIHPENNPVLIPMINNDIAHLLKRGGSAVVTYDGTTKSIDLTNVFDGSPSYWSIDPSNITTIVIELTLHKAFTYSNTVYVDFGASGWRAKSIKVEVMNTNYANDTWTQKGATTTNGSGHYAVSVSHTPSGASNSGGGFNKLRFTFSSWGTSNGFRIAALGIYNFGSSGLRETFLPKDGGEIYGSLSPFSSGKYNLGSSSKYWNHAYINNINGVAVGSSPKFTDTTYSNATTSASGLMSSSDKSKLDSIASGAQVNSITGVKGNSESSYRTGNVNITAANIGLGNVNNTSDANKPISTATQTALNAKAPLASPALTGTPTAPTATSGTNTTQIATTAFVQTEINNKIAAADAMIYKGTIGTSGTVTALPATHSTGWTYKVITAGTYAGQSCEVGDMIICLTDGTTATDSHWTVVQNNVNVVGTNGSVGLIKNGSSVTSTSGLVAAPIISGVPYYKDTTYSSKSAASGGTDVSLVTTGEKYTWNAKASTSVATTSANGLMSSTDKSKLDGIASGATAVTTSTVSGWGYTKNTGTVTSVATGAGLTGGTITGSGTVKANLRSETALTVDSAAATTTSGRVYPVAIDKSGYLSVNVPWTDNDTKYSSKTAASGGTDVSLVTTGEKYTWNSKASTAVATTSANGLMSSSDKSKLDGIATGATANTGTITGIKMNGSSKGTSGVVDLGTVITAHQTIKQDGITGATVNRYAACSVAAGTAAKTASVTGGTFALEAGSRVTVKFANANTASTPTLNINSTGAKNIYHKGAQITSGTNKSLLAGAVDFIYDGTQWHLVGNYIDTNTTYSSKSAASGGTDVSLVTTGEKATWNAKTSNTGTVTSVATGAGLTGGTITGTGTIKAKLRSETALTIDSSAATTTSGRVYPVAVDKSGYLSVNVPWTDNDTKYTHPTTSGNKHIPSGGSSGQVLIWSSDGTAVWGNESSIGKSAIYEMFGLSV